MNSNDLNINVSSTFIVFPLLMVQFSGSQSTKSNFKFVISESLTWYCFSINLCKNISAINSNPTQCSILFLNNITNENGRLKIFETLDQIAFVT